MTRSRGRAPGTCPDPRARARTVTGVSTRRRSTVAAPGLLAVAVAAVAGLAACHPAGERETGPETVEVTGEFGVSPTVTFDPPLTVREPSLTVVIDGDGPPLAPGEPLLVDWVAIDGATGDVLADTWTSAPGVHTLTEESLGEELYRAVTASGTNDRVLLLEPAAGDAGVAGSRVVVTDVRPARAQGEPVPVPEGLPEVSLAANGEPIVSIPAAAPPADRVEQLLAKGTGAQVRPDSVLIVQYKVVQWSDNQVRASTWGEGALPQQLDMTTALPGLTEGLLDHTEGSQVLIIAPPEQTTGDDTLVFVVDILAVVRDAEASATPTATPTPAATPADPGVADDGQEG